MKRVLLFFLRLFRLVAAVFMVPILFLLAAIARYCPKRIDVGLGPEPLISYVHHKKALARAGYTAETFVNEVYFITDDFDVRGDLYWHERYTLLRGIGAIRLWFWCVRRYRCIYHSFNGSALTVANTWRWLDPFLYKLADVKVVILPYGGDVQDFTRSPNLYFKHAVARDYPDQRRQRRRIAAQIDRWTCHADHLVGGVEWVDYMYYWHTLMLGHFSIDTESWRPAEPQQAEAGAPVKVLHAPNHRTIKGTCHFVRAVEELRAEGLPVELTLVERASNEEIHNLIAEVDIVADQLVAGWYAMFAIEGMAKGKPVLCYLRPDLLELYVNAGVVQPGEIPIAGCTPADVKEVLRRLVENPAERAEIGRRGRAFVEKYHSLDAVGAMLDRINSTVGIKAERQSVSKSG